MHHPDPDATPLLQLRKIDPTRNMQRFYLLDVRPTLFGEWSVVRCWGRIGGGSRLALTTLTSEAEAQRLAERTAARKRRRGYADLPLASASDTPPSPPRIA